jgi:hypothetical protein
MNTRHHRSLEGTTIQRSEPGSPIHIRRSRITDLPALRRMARLQDQTLPSGAFLIGEIRGNIVAAAPLETDAPALGTPRPCSEQLQYLLHRQARFVRASSGGRSTASLSHRPQNLKARH